MNSLFFFWTAGQHVYWIDFSALWLLTVLIEWRLLCSFDPVVKPTVDPNDLFRRQASGLDEDHFRVFQQYPDSDWPVLIDAVSKNLGKFTPVWIIHDVQNDSQDFATQMIITYSHLNLDIDILISHNSCDIHFKREFTEFKKHMTSPSSFKSKLKTQLFSSAYLSSTPDEDYVVKALVFLFVHYVSSYR